MQDQAYNETTLAPRINQLKILELIELSHLPVDKNIILPMCTTVIDVAKLLRKVAKEQGLLNTQEWIDYEMILSEYSTADPTKDF